MTDTWGYNGNHGPSSWPSMFPAAKGRRQSPVDIQLKKTQYDSQLSERPLEIRLGPEESMIISNTGHTVKADCSRESTLSGGPLGDRVYRLAQFHMHWGAEDRRGSEHTIDGRPYAAEIHLVYWNTSNYKTFDQAATQSDGLAVLCVFIKVGKEHEGFGTISNYLRTVTWINDLCELDITFDPASLLPANTTRYWTYPGSLTTPPCFESVQFIIFEEAVEFSREQMLALRDLRTGGYLDSSHLEDNFRPTCDLGQRTVLASFQS